MDRPSRWWKRTLPPRRRAPWSPMLCAMTTECTTGGRGENARGVKGKQTSPRGGFSRYKSDTVFECRGHRGQERRWVIISKQASGRTIAWQPRASLTLRPSFSLPCKGAPAARAGCCNSDSSNDQRIFPTFPTSLSRHRKATKYPPVASIPNSLLAVSA